MNIIIISLERAKERREKMHNQLKFLGLDAIVIDAVDGELLSEREKDKKINLLGGYRYGDKFKPGEIGCTMSHIKAIEYAKQNNWPYVIIFEDDIVIAEDFKRRINFLFKILPSDWEHVYLSGLPKYKYFYAPMLNLMNIVPSIFTSGTFSMLISSIAYDKIINHLNKFITTTDDSYCDLIINSKLKSYTFYPFVTYTNNDYTFIWNKEIKEVHASKKYFINKMHYNKF